MPSDDTFDSVYLPYNRTLTERARENRKNPTKAESKIWHEVLRMRQFANFKFIRQKPIYNYIQNKILDVAVPLRKLPEWLFNSLLGTFIYLPAGLF